MIRSPGSASWAPLVTVSQNQHRTGSRNEQPDTSGHTANVTSHRALIVPEVIGPLRSCCG